MNTPKRTNARIFLFVSMLLSFLMLGAALIAPVAARADNDNNHKKPQVKRYYDKKNHDYHEWNDNEEHKDYHEWNDNEDRAYRSYLQENHQDYREFKAVKPPQQQEYFGWRHEHPDSVLFKLEIR